MLRRRLTYAAACCSVIVCLAPGLVSAQSASPADIQKQIDEHNTQIAQLDQEIAQYQQQLDAVSAKKQTLQTALSQLNLTIKKTNASISVTKNQIGSTQLQITQLSNGIASKQSSIQDEQAGVGEALRRLNATDNVPLVVAALSSSDISALWEDISALERFQIALGAGIKQLQQDKQDLTDSKTAAEKKKQQLLDQQQTLLTQQGSLNAQKQAQTELLAQTKSQESTYQQLIAQKRAQEDSLQQALTDLQSQYNQVVNPSSYPPPTPRLLNWPFSADFMASCISKARALGNSYCITQYFGNTPFAQVHASVYGGNGHNAIDIGVPIGTPVLAALSGVILGTGNTDAIRGCYSFGKWVMIKHNNGLNTMYAHLSQISVTEGQQVTTGQLIGYSGETGYATGPHLHFGVYVSAVTKIIPLGQATKSSKTPCHLAVMPVPPVSGYLNPLNYLPPIN